MILQALKQLADAEHLCENLDYELKRISWRIVIDVDGKLISLADYRLNLNEATNKKPKYVGRWAFVPRQPTRTSGDLAFFLVDKAEYVLGIDPAGRQKAKKLLARRALFQQAIVECAEQTNDKTVKAVAAFLNQVHQEPAIVKNQLNFEHLEPNDLIGFVIDSQWVHDREAAKKYYSAQRASGSDDPESDPYQCLVTGESVADVPLFPLLKKVPGGTSSGVALVSHNSNAFFSYGFKGNDNAPISRKAAETCGCALTRLLDPDYPDPQNLDSALGKRHARLGANTIVCFWTKQSDEESGPFLDVLTPIIEGQNEKDVTTAYQSIWHGKPAPLKNPNDFYALTLSGTQGRAIVRDWLETSLAEVNKHLANHFADLKICRNTRPKKGEALTPAIPLYWLLNSLAAEGRSEPVPPAVEASFVRSALQGSKYPFQLLQRALVRARAEAGKDDWANSMRRDARAAILRAVLNRQREPDPDFKDYPEVDEEMNPMLDSPGYSCGMLIAVLERLQALAIGDVNASIIDRFFAAASASPRSVFVRLLKNSQHHYRKAKDDSDPKKRGGARYMERLKDEILSRFDVEGSHNKASYPTSLGFPLHLNLEQQGLFVLGYHQMRHWLWMPKDERKKWEKQYPDAPAVFKRKRQEEDETEEKKVESTAAGS